MKTSTFITNIVCENCVQEVSMILQQTHWIQDFVFDISNGKNYLKVTFHEAYSAQDIIKVIEQIGYSAKERKSVLRFFTL
jgi:copper chaperone CopZ